MTGIAENGNSDTGSFKTGVGFQMLVLFFQIKGMFPSKETTQ